MSVILASLAILAAQPQTRVPSQTGNIKTHTAFESKILGNKRDLNVLLPPGYDQSTARYPVLLVMDGQNVFDGVKSYIPNLEWRVDETVQMLISSRLIEPIIVVAVDNTGAGRMDEYTPSKTARGAGKGDQYGEFLRKELLPFIFSKYRAKNEGASTGITGASLGGLIAMHLGMKMPDRFGRLGVMSPSVWWDEKVILKTVAAYKAPTKGRIWIDIGTRESQDAAPDARALRNALIQKGWVLGKNLAYVEEVGAEHNEGAWARRFGEMLMFLYGTPRA